MRELNMMDVLQRISDELDKWKRVGMTAAMWWRDDDAAEPCVELDRLIRLSDGHAVPCGLATIPTRSGEPLGKVVSRAQYIWIIQHGYAHKNHAPSGAGAWELGLHRPKFAVLDDLRKGMLTLSQLFNDRFVPVVVPPWNKMDSELMPSLSDMGFLGVSASYKRQRPTSPAGIRVADAHCDVLSWKKKQAGFAGVEHCVTDIVEHLKDKRTGSVDSDEPTCVLTHHLEMDEAAWDFMEGLFSVTSAHCALQWVSPADIWNCNQTNTRQAV
jgi:hypothetical protein